MLRGTLRLALGLAAYCGRRRAIFAMGRRYDRGPLAARRLTTLLARRVTIDSLHATPGRWSRSK
jgi:hypothetical protein